MRKREGKIDADDLAISTACGRPEEISEHQVKFYYSPSGEAMEKVDDWIRKKETIGELKLGGSAYAEAKRHKEYKRM